jgi:tripeptidyl-peptidase-1
MQLLGLAIVTAFAARVIAAPFPENHVVHERRDYVPKAWIKRDRLSADVELPVRVGMTQRNLENGYDLLLEV